MRTYNFAISGSNLTKLYQTTRGVTGVIMVQVSEGVSPTKFGKAKTSKIRRDFWQLSTLRANNAGIDRHNENLKSKWSPTTPPMLEVKNLVNFGTQTKSYRRGCWTKLTFSRRLYYGAQGVLARQIFYTPYNPLKCIPSRTWGAWRPQVGLCRIFLVFFLNSP